MEIMKLQGINKIKTTWLKSGMVSQL